MVKNLSSLRALQAAERETEVGTYIESRPLSSQRSDCL